MNTSRDRNTSELLHVHIRDGMSQARRKLPALDKGYFDIDEQRFEQLLEQMQDYSQLIKFQGIELGDEFTPLLFSKNELMVMVKILAINVDKVERDLQEQLYAAGNVHSKNDNFVTTLDIMTPTKLIAMFDYWLSLLYQPQSEAGEQLYRLIESVVLGLSKELSSFLRLAVQHSIDNPVLSNSFNILLKKTQYAIDYGDDLARDQELDVESLNASLLKALEMIQKGIGELLPISMTSQNNDPAIALRIVFVKLYQKLQEKLNRFTLNLFDFYFTDVLQAKPNGLIPDSVYLVLHPNIKGRDIVIPKGMEFIAGIDKNSQDIIYRVSQEQIVNDAQVVRLHSVYFPKDAGNTESAVLADACWLDNITAAPSADKKVRDEMIAHPLLGAVRSETDVNTAMDARLGFAIANKILFLSEGRRQVDITIQFSAQMGTAWSSLKKILQELLSSKRSKSDNNAKFFAHFGSMFDLRITTETGWLAIGEYKPAFNGSDKAIKNNALRLSFYLPESAPAITAYDAVIHGDEYECAVPVLQILIKENFIQYPYDILRKLVIREISIDVSVEGVRNLILYNNIGPLSVLSPFAPFGPLPEVGSYFVVGSEEICYKQLTAIDFDIEWSGLPNCSGAFGSWYAGYGQIKSAKNFVVSASVMADGQWQPTNSGASHYQVLFTNKLRNGQEWLIPQQKLFGTLAIPYYKPQIALSNNKSFRYSALTKSGLFKFTLQGPVGGFGHREYSTLLTNTLTYNSRIKSERLMRAMPNFPYTPEISAIRLNYSAAAIVNLNKPGPQSDPLLRDQFFHLHPLGWESITPLQHSRVYLVPQYKDDGALLIGLTGSDCAQLSLFFHLKNNSLPIKSLQVSTELVTSEASENNDSEIIYSIEPATKVQWEYLSNNQWRTIPEKNVIGDSTRNFMTSGIVQLLIPADITTENTLLPAGLFWLKVSANQQLAHFSEVYSVYAQAVKANWIAGEHPANEHAMVLVPDSIKRTRQNIPGIASVTQICSSFGGVTAESIEHLRTRMSERLRHKNRALTPLDYEMLILNQFPQIYKVKCFANMRMDTISAVCPGHLLIIPIPHCDWMNGQNFKPHFDGYLIDRILNFVKELAPAFAEISVENPVYEEIQVRCAVHFREGRHHGYHHNLLNQALCDYLSPWSSVGNNVHFGWSVSEQHIKSFIHNLDYIEHITDFSLLRIAPREQGLYVLDDTVALATEGNTSGRILPSFWWSTAIPIENHYIVSLDENEHIGAQVTGYDELEVGSTFIIA
jgi:hypothetical protein